MRVRDRMRIGPGVVLASVCVVVLLCTPAQATTYTFVPGGANDWWMTNTNWSPVGVPNSVNDVAVFNASALPNYSTNVHNTWYTVQELRFATPSAWRIHNNQQDVILDGPAGSAWITQNGSGAVTFDCDLQLNDTTTFTGTGTGDMTVNGSILPAVRNGIYGAGGLVKQGSYTLFINPAGSYAGGTTIDQGAIQIGNAAALGTGAAQINAGGTLNAAGTNPANDITLSGGTLYVGNGASGTITLNNVAGNTINANGNYRILSGQITGAGGFTFGGINTPGLALSNPANNFQGDVTINPGSYLGVWASEVIPDTADVTGGGQLRLQGDGRTETIAGLSGGGRIFAVNGGVGATLRVGAGGATSTYSGRIGLGGVNNKNITLVKIGAGTLTLSGNSDYTGGTTVDAGTLAVGHVNALGVGPATVNSGGTLNLGGYNVGNDMTLNGGTLYVGNGASGTITLNNVAGNTINANGNYRILSGQVTGAGGFTFGGINTPGLALSNPANDFQGDVTINPGSYLGVWASEVIPDTADVTLGGYLRLQGANRTETIGGLNGGGVIFTWTGGSTATLRVGANNASGSYSGTVGGSWDALTRDIHLVKIGSGTQSLSGILYHNDDTTVEGGTLRLNRTSVPFPSGGSSGQFAAAHTVTVNSGAALQVNGNWVMGGGLTNKVVVNGGTLQFLNSDNYMGNIELTGGAITTSGGTRPWRTGNWGSGLITVNPSASSSTIQGSLCFVGTGAAPRTTFDVADGGAADDLVVSARIFDHPGFERRMMLVKDGPGKMILSNNSNTFAGGVTINDGTLSVTSLSAGNTPCALGASYGIAPLLVFNGGTLEYTGPTVGGINRAFTINAGGATLDITNLASTVTWTDAAGAGPIVGSGMLTKAGPGTLVLASSNAYTGGTTVDDGTLRLGHVNSLGTGAATVNSGATLDLAGSNVANDITLNGGTLYVANGASGTITLNNVAGNTINANGHYRVLSGRITGPGGFTFGGINTPGLALSNPANDFQGDVTVNSNAYLGVWADEVIPDTASLTLLGQLRLQGDSRTETIAGLNGSNRIFAVNGGVGATLRVGAGGASGSYSGPIGLGGANNKNISLVKIGAGTQTLSGVLDHTGGTTVDGGTLRLNRAGVPFPGAGATGQFTSAHTVTVNSGAALQLNATWITGDGLANQVVVNGGTLEFLNSDNYLGNIQLTGGHITTSGGLRPWRTGNWGNGLIGVNPSASSSTIQGSLCFVGTAAAPQTTFDVADGAAAYDLVMSALIYDHPGFEGRMTLVKSGAGTMVLSGANTYTGPTTINDGTLQIDGSITSDTTVNGGWLKGSGTVFGDVDVLSGGSTSAGAAPGKLTIDGDYTQTGTMLAEIGGHEQGVDYDLIWVNGLADLDGYLDVALLAGFEPVAWHDHFDVLVAVEGIIDRGLILNSHGPGSFFYEIVPYPDAGQSAEALRLTHVPEPSSLTLLGLAGLGLLVRRRRKS